MIINTQYLHLNGEISVCGEAGVAGGGGGAGGSLVLNSTFLYGTGLIRVNGGDGGFSGGMISGE